MAARNYTTCPRCVKRAKKLQEQRHTKAAKAYGNATPEEYQRLLKLAQNTESPQSTLGEYYEFDFREDGTFKLRYDVHCQKCGFNFQHEATVANALGE